MLKLQLLITLTFVIQSGVLLLLLLLLLIDVVAIGLSEAWMRIITAFHHSFHQLSTRLQGWAAGIRFGD